ncbi:MAG: DUF1838 family protein [Rhodospirillaceae bacterium]|nr:DUF1838 family protein [Rhodospirillaceae bacterium]
MTSTHFSRRAGIGMLSGTLLAATAGTHASGAGSTRSAQPRPYEFASDADLIHALMRMRGRTDGNVNFGWLRANRYCYIEGEVRPLLSLVAGFISRADRNNDGTYTVNSAEITYYTDFNTGALLDVLEMPVTGKKVAVPLYRSEPRETLIAKQTQIREVSGGNAGMTSTQSGAESTEPTFAPRGDVLLERSVGPAIIAGESLSIRTSEYGRVKPYDKAFAPVFYKESAIWTARLEDVLRNDGAFVPTTLSYSASDSWRPWMKMDNVPGHTMGDGIGGKVERFEDLPEDFLEFTKARHPDVFRDPKSAMAS